MNIIKITALITSLLITSEAWAKRDFWIPNLKKGDTISAEVFNEVFEKIQMSQMPPEQNDLEGDWTCQSVLQSTSLDADVLANGWEYGESGLCLSLNSTITFSTVGQTPWIESDVTQPFVGRFFGSRLNTDYEIMDDTIYVKVNQGLGGQDQVLMYSVQRMGDTAIKLKPIEGNQLGTLATVFCEKAELPPEAPVNVAANMVSSSTVRLTWTDIAENEDEFIIYRRGKGDSDFSEIGRADENAISYDDNPGNGTWFYKVIAENGHGKSEIPGVMKVVVGE